MRYKKVCGDETFDCSKSEVMQTQRTHDAEGAFAVEASSVKLVARPATTWLELPTVYTRSLSTHHLGAIVIECHAREPRICELFKELPHCGADALFLKRVWPSKFLTSTQASPSIPLQSRSHGTSMPSSHCTPEVAVLTNNNSNNHSNSVVVESFACTPK